MTEITWGIVIVDHGSKRQQSNDQLLAMVELFKSRCDYDIVEPAHMELASPTIADAFGRCVQRGATGVVVSPFFLLPGRHWTHDIPELTSDAAKAHPGVVHRVAAPLGLHPLMVEIMDHRIRECLED